MNGQPSASQILLRLHQLEEDRVRRNVLSGGFSIYQALVADGFLDPGDLHWLARRMHELHGDGLIDFESRDGGVREPVTWDGDNFQMFHGWRVTGAGRAEATRATQQSLVESVREDGTMSVPEESAGDSAVVAVMHGRDEPARKAVFGLLRAFGLRPLEWEELVQLTGDAAPYNGQAVDAAFGAARAVVVVLTPDDIGWLHPQMHGEREEPGDREPTGQPRLNVVLEAGMAMQSHPKRTILVEIGHTRHISDLAGRNSVRVTGEPRSLQSLRSRLMVAGCAVREGGDWLDFAETFGSLDALSRKPHLPDASATGRRQPSTIAGPVTDPTGADRGRRSELYEHLIRSLADRDSDVRFGAMQAIGDHLGPELLPAIKVCLNDSDDDVRRYAHEYYAKLLSR